MRFVKLRAENFKSFENFSVELDGHGFVKIDGVNNTDNFSESVGSGKSTIADALSYALTGETVKGNSSMSDVKNMLTKGKCYVSVIFEHNGKTYEIVRGEDGLILVEDGVDISKHLKRETQELIEQMFPMFTPTFIGATVIIGQNMPNAFTNNKPSARKQILEELTNSSFMIEEIKTMLAERKNEWQSEVGSLQTEIVVLNTKMQANIQSIGRAKKKLEGLRDPAELESEITSVEEFVKDTEEKLAGKQEELQRLLEEKDKAMSESARLSGLLDEARTRHNEFVQKGIEGMLKEKSAEESDLSGVRAEYRAKDSEIQKLRAEIRRLQSVQTHCPTCGQPLPDAHKIDTTAQEEELGRLVGELEELKVKGNNLAENISEVEDKISEFKRANATSEEVEELRVKISEANGKASDLSEEVSAAQSFIRSREAEVKGWTSKAQSMRLELSEIGSVRKSCEEEIERAESEANATKAEEEKLSEKLDKKQARLSTLNQVISFATRDFRTILLSSIIRRLDAYAKSYCKKMLDTTEIEFKDDGNNISITYLGRDFGVLSGGESQIVKMCITLALKKTLEDLVGFTTNIMFWDEVLDNTDQSTAQQIVELVSSLDLSSSFFISHHTDVFLPIDQTWTVTKTDGISVLEVSRV